VHGNTWGTSGWRLIKLLFLWVDYSKAVYSSTCPHNWIPAELCLCLLFSSGRNNRSLCVCGRAGGRGGGGLIIWCFEIIQRRIPLGGQLSPKCEGLGAWTTLCAVSHCTADLLAEGSTSTLQLCKVILAPLGTSSALSNITLVSCVICCEVKMHRCHSSVEFTLTNRGVKLCYHKATRVHAAEGFDATCNVKWSFGPELQAQWAAGIWVCLACLDSPESLFHHRLERRGGLTSLHEDLDKRVRIMSSRWGAPLTVERESPWTKVSRASGQSEQRNSDSFCMISSHT